MRIRVHDRLVGGVVELPEGPVLLSRHVFADDERSLRLGPLAIAAGDYLAPDRRGRWALRQGAIVSREGSCPAATELDALDADAVSAVGRLVNAVVGQGTWAELIRLSPLVPEMSERAELNRFELSLEKRLGHVEEVCSRPRAHLRVETERTRVSLARRLPARAAAHLASHTEDWDRPTLRGVVPKRILALVRDEELDIYENRLAVRLVDDLHAYLRKRLHQLERLLGVFAAAADHTGGARSGSHWRQARVYRLWGEAFVGENAQRTAMATARRLNALLHRVRALMGSPLYRALPDRSGQPVVLRTTNVLTNDPHYRRLAEIWQDLARHARGGTMSAGEQLEATQALCRGFQSFGLLLVARALAQLGFVPQTPEAPLAEGSAVLVRRGQRVHLSWGAGDHVVAVTSGGVDSLRIVPMYVATSLLSNGGVDRLANEVAASSVCGSTVMLYPGGHSVDGNEPPCRLPHEVSREGREGLGLVPVSPWDIGSVERIARLIRWATWGPRFRSYPPALSGVTVPPELRAAPWLTKIGAAAALERPLLERERKGTAELVSAATRSVGEIVVRHEEADRELREAHRAARATAGLNARKKLLNAEQAAAEARRRGLAAFEQAVGAADASLRELLECPCCGDVAREEAFDARDGGRFGCECGGCGTRWGTERCSACQSPVPILVASGALLGGATAGPGWIDRVLGADVLAVPASGGDHPVFVCPACGEPVRV